METTKTKPNTWDLISDFFIVFYILTLFFAGFLDFFGPMIFDDWFYGPTRYLRAFIWIVSNMSLILVGVTIKNLIGKIIGTLFALITALYFTYNQIHSLLYGTFY